MSFASRIGIALPGAMRRLGLVFAAAAVFVFLMNPPEASYAHKAFGLLLVFTLGQEYRRSEEKDAGQS